MIDLNRANVEHTEFCELVNGVLDAGALTAEREARRPYLGASSIGSECLRRVQLDWTRDSHFPARTQRIFERGHAMEETMVKAFHRAGWRMERGTSRTRFEALDGLFKGHCDGIILDGPLFMKYPTLWEHKCIGATGWNKLQREGLKKAYPQYYDQCQIYMAYLDLTEHPAILTATNADDCKVLHIPVQFDATSAQAASDRAVAIIKATQHREVMPRVASKPEDWRCKMCPHKAVCWSE